MCPETRKKECADSCLMVCLAFGPVQGHGRCGYISRNDGHEYKVRCSKVSRGFFLGLVLGFSISSQMERVFVDWEGWLPGKLDTFHQRHLE